MHKLMIKTHNVTGLKYLCYTKKSGKAYDTYNGSGKAWLKHLEVFGKDISTELVFSCEDKQTFIDYARNYSIANDVVLSEEWANERHEEGNGGDTVSRKMWITDGQQSKYIDKGSEIPNGWYKGRSNCVFNDSSKQKEFSKRADRKKQSETMKQKWASGEIIRNDDYLKGNNSRNTDPIVRKKISEALKGKKKPKVRCDVCGFEGAGPGIYKHHFKNCKNV